MKYIWRWKMSRRSRHIRKREATSEISWYGSAWSNQRVAEDICEVSFAVRHRRPCCSACAAMWRTGTRQDVAIRLPTKGKPPHQISTLHSSYGASIGHAPIYSELSRAARSSAKFSAAFEPFRH